MLKASYFKVLLHFLQNAFCIEDDIHVDFGIVMMTSI